MRRSLRRRSVRRVACIWRQRVPIAVWLLDGGRSGGGRAASSAPSGPFALSGGGACSGSEGVPFGVWLAAGARQGGPGLAPCPPPFPCPCGGGGLGESCPS